MCQGYIPCFYSFHAAITILKYKWTHSHILKLLSTLNLRMFQLYIPRVPTKKVTKYIGYIWYANLIYFIIWKKNTLWYSTSINYLHLRMYPKKYLKKTLKQHVFRSFVTPTNDSFNFKGPSRSVFFPRRCTKVDTLKLRVFFRSRKKEAAAPEKRCRFFWTMPTHGV